MLSFKIILDEKRQSKRGDVVRGIAIILMVAAHTIAFYGPTSLTFLRYLGDALCFTIFLFLFGFSFFTSILQRKNDKDFKKKILKRVGILLFSYYLIAFISLLSEPKSIATTINTLLFIHVPSLTEFMLPFIFYSALLPLLFHLINPIFKKSKIFVFLSFSFLGILFYMLGTILFNFLSYSSVPTAIKSWLSLLSSSPDTKFFPLFQYLIVVLCGVYYGYFIDKEAKNEYKTNKIYYFGLIALFLLGLEFSGKFSILDPKERFPPSIPFIIMGVGVCLSMLLWVKIIGLGALERLLIVLGKHSLGIFLFHVSVIKLLQYKTLIVVNSSSEIFLMFCFLLFGYFFLLYARRKIQKIIL